MFCVLKGDYRVFGSGFRLRVEGSYWGSIVMVYRASGVYVCIWGLYGLRRGCRAVYTNYTLELQPTSLTLFFK